MASFILLFSPPFYCVHFQTLLMSFIEDLRCLRWRVMKQGIKFCFWGFPGVSDGKKYVCNVGDPGLIPGLGRSPGECLEWKGMPIRSSILTWRIPSTEEPAIGSQRVWHDWTTTLSFFPDFISKDMQRTLWSLKVTVFSATFWLKVPSHQIDG